MGILDEAIDNYKKALALKPDYAEAINNLGLALQYKGKIDEAIENYNKALIFMPDYTEAHGNIPASYYLKR